MNRKTLSAIFVVALGVLPLVAGAETNSPSSAQENTPAFGEAVNGLKTTLVPLYQFFWRKGTHAQGLTMDGAPSWETTCEKEGYGTPPCVVLDDQGSNVLVVGYCMAPPHPYEKVIFQKADIVRKTETGCFTLRFENTSTKPLALGCDRLCNLYDHVFLKGPDEKIFHAQYQGQEHEEPFLEQLAIESGKAKEVFFEPWFHRLIKPALPGEYMLWVEFEQNFSGKDNHRPDMGKGYWTGKIRSNAVKVTIEGDNKSAITNQR
jgi:hypothetical protein